MASEQILEVQVWRGDEMGKHASYQVPRAENQTVLDVVTYIQRKIDPTLTYRFSCRVGMCGSCAMTVNGVPRWTCRTHVSRVADEGRLRIEPLRNLPIVKDLSVEMTPFFEKQKRVGVAFQPSANRKTDFAVINPQSQKRRAADAAIECIGCAVCFASCDVVTWNPEYAGPAALNRVWTLINDVRDSGGTERLAAIAGDAGCHACHSHQSCTERCPKHLAPTASIAGLKRACASTTIRGKL
ncbi:MAG: succinate dehydrogenase/fumarate reductase iron-sulfur subunit [Rhodospirillales bacterium]|nr:succinate dehydrogenase/fumarate reductase iron-sulfur subunit [Rhodospirillales bacterium]